MIPSNLDLTNATPSERNVFNLLKSQLRPDVHVFYSISWQYLDKNGKRQQSECDFLIIDPKYGFLTCEVKGGYNIEIDNNGNWKIWDTPFEYHGLTRSPQLQAEENARYFQNLYKKTYKMDFEGVYGSFTLFPNYNITNPELLDNRPKDIVLDANNLTHLCESIDNVFRYYKGRKRVFFNLDQYKKMMELVNDRKAIAAAAGELIQYKEKEFDVINRVQDGYIYFIKEHTQVLIAGGAGTGKTWIAMKLAVQSAMQNKNTLLVCHNEELAKYIEEQLKDVFNCSIVNVMSFKELLINDKINLDYIDYPYKLYDEYKDDRFQHYDTVIVDEAQDFDKYEALIIRLHIIDDNKSNLYVFYDKTQNLYHKDFADGFMIKENTFHLHENLRNTASIYNFACEKTQLGNDVIANQIIGCKPEKKNFNSLFDMTEYIEDLLNRLIDKEYVDSKFITILVNGQLFNLFNNKTLSKWKISNDKKVNSINISLVENFKGMESNIVIYLHDSNTDNNYDYVAYTRAKYYLYDFNLNE